MRLPSEPSDASYIRLILIRSAGRTPRQRTTLYGVPPESRLRASFGAAPLTEPVNPPVRDAGLKAPPRLVRPGFRTAAR